MAGIYETDQVGQVQEISNAVFNIRADETPFTSMLKKDKKPHPINPGKGLGKKN